VMYRRQPRLGSICAFLAAVLFAADTLYQTTQTALPTTAKQSTLQVYETFLTFTHQHGTAFAVPAGLSILGVAALVGTIFALYQYMTVHGKRGIGRIALIVGLTAVALSCVSAAVFTFVLSSAANDYAAHHLASTVKTFENRDTMFSILDVVGAEGLAIWLGLVAVTIIRIQGNRSIPGWGTLGACVLTGIGFPLAPVMVVWSTGAGVGLWRLSNAPLSFDPVEDEMFDQEIIEVETTPVPARQAPVNARAASPSHTRRPVGQQGSASKRRRRR
jgi:hypothetical protein